MRTKHKLIIILTIIGLIVAATIIVVVRINNNQRKIVQDSHAVQLQRNIETFININTNYIRQAAVDYTFWDEMVRFVHIKDRKWADENIETMLLNFKIDAVWVFDQEHTLIYNHANEPQTCIAHFPVTPSIMDSLHKARVIRTIVFCDSTILEVIGATIHPTNDPGRKSAPQGYFFIAKVWTRQQLEVMGQVTQTKLSFSLRKPAESNSNKNIVTTHIVLHDWLNHVVGYLQIERKLVFIKLYDRSSNRLLAAIVIPSLIIIALFAYFSSIWVNRPLRLIEEILESYDTNKIRKLKSYSKEFNQIGRLITKFFQRNEKLKQAMDRAENANRLKTSFLMNMSHEIRTPMNGIIGLSEQLIHGDLQPEMKRIYVDEITQSCNHLLQIVDDVLDISKIETDEVKVMKNIFVVEELLHDLSEYFSHKPQELKNKPIHLQFIAPTENKPTSIYSDKRLLSNILKHLIKNAIKFTNNGNVEISYYIEENQLLVFYVKDSGIGIPADKLSIIFERFRQADESPTRSHGGNGLGLAISKGLIELLGGKIWVESEPSRGSVFYISLPDCITSPHN